MARPDRAGERRKRTLTSTDTIFALSSGAPPAAIAVIRISGARAFQAGEALAGRLPKPRMASLRTLRNAAGEALDRALVLVFPAAQSVTGEDLVELHCHGGRAIVAAVDDALGALPGLRRAQPGEFTRRALANGRIDLAQAEALGDLLRAETEQERRVALAGFDGAVSLQIANWRERLLALSVRVEAALEFAEDEDDVSAAMTSLEELNAAMLALRHEMAAVAAAPTVERRREGFRVVLAGPRNAGKSTLFNLLASRDVAIVSPIAGTTRDRLEAPVQHDGLNYLLVDTAGLVAETSDPIEALGIKRTDAAIATADLVLWLGDDPPPERGNVWIWPRSDLPDRVSVPSGALSVSRQDVHSIQAVWTKIASYNSPSNIMMFVLNNRQIADLMTAIDCMNETDDLLVMAEQLRLARSSIGASSHDGSVEALLDRVFSTFCIGK